MFKTLTLTNKPLWRNGITGHAIWYSNAPGSKLYFDRIDKQQQIFTPTEVDIGATIEM